LVALSQREVSVDSASKYIGALVTVCSKVYGVKVLDKITFINMGAPYHKSPLTVVIFTKDLVNFKETPEKLYSDKDICITGKIDDYKGKNRLLLPSRKILRCSKLDLLQFEVFTVNTFVGRLQFHTQF
jgi:hypothetical protein